MIRCPKCQATLPDGAYQCQFCNTSFGAAPPPPVRAPGRTPVAGAPYGRSTAPIQYRSSGQPRWVWPAYYAVAGWWILDGVRTIAASALMGGIGVFSLLVGLASALVGLGLILRIELARGIVNVLAFIQILDGAFGLIIGFFIAPILGFWGALAMVFSAIRIALGILMIFLIGETESRAPNF